MRKCLRQANPGRSAPAIPITNAATSEAAMPRKAKRTSGVPCIEVPRWSPRRIHAYHAAVDSSHAAIKRKTRSRCMGSVERLGDLAGKAGDDVFAVEGVGFPQHLLRASGSIDGDRPPTRTDDPYQTGLRIEVVIDLL